LPRVGIRKLPCRLDAICVVAIGSVGGGLVTHP
jgi:hypothetical protein